MEQQYVTVNGVEMCYLQSGPGPGADGAPAAVLIHGNTGSNLWYSRAMDVPGLSCYAPDMPNFGCSGHIDTADIDTYADYVKAFADALGLEAPVIVGHSLGGAVAMSYALRYPEAVSKLMLVDSAPPDGLQTPEEHYPIIEQYKNDRNLLKQALGGLLPSLTDDAFFDELVDRGMAMNPIAFSGNARALARFDYADRTASFTKPVLVVVGKKDLLITEEIGQKTAAAFPNARFEALDDVGHAVMVEDPPRFAELLGRFAR
jgi:branched-chain amino acid transport system permease protein